MPKDRDDQSPPDELEPVTEGGAHTAGMIADSADAFARGNSNGLELRREEESMADGRRITFYWFESGKPS